MIRYSNLEPITDTAPAASFTILGTSGADTITITDGSGGTTTVSSPTFESVTFANKTSVVLDGNGGADTVVFNNPTPAAGLTSFIVTNVGSVSQTGAIRYPSFAVSATGNVTLVGANDVDHLEISSQTGTVSYRDDDDVSIGGVSPSIAGVTAGTSVVLNAGNINVTAADANITAPTVFLNASESIAVGTGGFANSISAGENLALGAIGNIVVAGAATVASTGGVRFSGRDVVIDRTAAGAPTITAGYFMGLLATTLTIEGTLSGSSGAALDARRLTIDPLAQLTFPGMAVVTNYFGAIRLGPATDTSPTDVELSQAEISRINASTLLLHAVDGAIEVSQPITFPSELWLWTGGLLTPIPTLSAWMMMMFAGLLALVALRAAGR